MRLALTKGSNDKPSFHFVAETDAERFLLATFFQSSYAIIRVERDRYGRTDLYEENGLQVWPCDFDVIVEHADQARQNGVAGLASGA